MIKYFLALAIMFVPYLVALATEHRMSSIARWLHHFFSGTWGRVIFCGAGGALGGGALKDYPTTLAMWALLGTVLFAAPEIMEWTIRTYSGGSNQPLRQLFSHGVTKALFVTAGLLTIYLALRT